MKQYKLRELYSGLGKAIENGLPFEITNHNRVVAIVVDKEPKITETPQLKNIIQKNKKDPIDLPKKDGVVYCEHGTLKSICKKCMFKK